MLGHLVRPDTLQTHSPTDYMQKIYGSVGDQISETPSAATCLRLCNGPCAAWVQILSLPRPLRSLPVRVRVLQVRGAALAQHSPALAGAVDVG